MGLSMLIPNGETRSEPKWRGSSWLGEGQGEEEAEEALEEAEEEEVREEEEEEEPKDFMELEKGARRVCRLSGR